MLALTRTGANTAALAGTGVAVRSVEFDDGQALRGALHGVACVVSALNGLEGTVVGLQRRVLDAAVAAGVPRFIPSD